MKYVDIKAVLQLAKNITSDAKTLTSNAEELRSRLSALEGTFHDDGFEEVNEYSRSVVSKIYLTKEALDNVVCQLIDYANLLKQGKGNSYPKDLLYPDMQSVSPEEREHNSFITGKNDSTVLVRKKTAEERLQDFKIGLAAIDQVIENYAESLESRGMQRGPVMAAILEHQRHIQQAELLRNINGDFSAPVRTLTAKDFDSIIESCRQRGYLTYSTAYSEPRSLSVTRYGFTMQTVNGTEMRLYNDPAGTNAQLIQQQGKSRYDMDGTCGLCQCANLLILAGVNGITEDTIVSAAMHCSDDILDCMDILNPCSGDRGGTTVRGRQEILGKCGLPTYSLPVSYNRRKTTQALSEAIRTGHGVIVSVDVAYLWQNGQRGGHAISLISVSEDGNTFIYNDTGSGTMGMISSHDLEKALTGRPANVTVNIIR